MCGIRPYFSLVIFYFLLSCIINGCGTINSSISQDLPPVLAQDELLRPYTSLGRIQVTRRIFGSDLTLTPDITAWGIAAVRREAEKMAADAVMLVEVSGGTTVNGMLPATEYRATGVALKFK